MRGPWCSLGFMDRIPQQKSRRIESRCRAGKATEGPSSETPGAMGLMILVPIGVTLLHEPPMANDQRLASERIGPKCRKQQRNLGYVCLRRELAVHGFLQHNVLDHFLLGDAE